MSITQIVRAVDAETKRKMIGGGIAATILASTIVVMLGFIGGSFSPRYLATDEELVGGVLITINSPVTTSFGTYSPYGSNFDPIALEYTIAPDLSNVVNRDAFVYLNAHQKTMLEENGFVVIPQEEFHQIYEILESNRESGIPNFITSDAVLHAFHVCYDLALRETEVYSFWDLLGNLTFSMLEDSIATYADAPAGDWKEAARRNVAYFTVAALLIDNTTSIYPAVEDDVLRVMNLIKSASEMTNDWFMGYNEDFSQYIPRGHYTRSDILSKYFLVMMWYGRIQFRLSSDDGTLPTQQAILLSLDLSNIVNPLGISGYDVWDAIYEPTAFFVGSSDDLTPPEYLQVIDEVFGTSPSWITLQEDALIQEFIQRAAVLRDPEILGSPVADTEISNVTKGLRLMGQRFIPDSYILGELVYDKVGTALEPRLMPSGLDVMAAFGSERAYTLQEEEQAFKNYVEQMGKLMNYITNMDDTDWTQNLYYLWMYSLLPLLSTPEEGYPAFMRNQAWIDKELNTALASWTELRHDTVLYAKQSYTVGVTSVSPSVTGYVEPIPELYSRLISLSDMMLDGMTSRSLLAQESKARLVKLREFLVGLYSISVKQLTNQPLNATDMQIIEGASLTLQNVSSYPSDDDLTSDADKFMSLVVEVHTDPNNNEVLEEAVGNPFIILVIVPIDGQLYIARGGTFSYYEFTRSIDGRLTDEEWQSMLESGSEPDLPEWTASFIASASVQESYLLATWKDEE